MNIEEIQTVTISNTQIVLAIDYEDDLSARYTVLTKRDNEIVDIDYDYEEERAIELFLSAQKDALLERIFNHFNH